MRPFPIPSPRSRTEALTRGIPPRALPPGLAAVLIVFGCLAWSCSGGGESGEAGRSESRPQAAAQQIPPPPPGSGTGESGLAWTTPAGWVEQAPSSAMRKAQYEVPGSGGVAELVVFYFGPNQGGDPLSNAERWAKQFKKPDGSSAVDAMRTEEREFAGLPVLLTEVEGTYTNTMVSQESFPDYALLGAVVEGPDANWFFKLTGPEATVRENREAFFQLLGSLQTGS